MRADQFVMNVRKELSLLLAVGAVSSTSHTQRTFASLANQAKSLGLSDLSSHLDELALQLQTYGSLAFEPSNALTDHVLRVFNRVEHLASELLLLAIEEHYSQKASH